MLRKKGVLGAGFPLNFHLPQIFPQQFIMILLILPLIFSEACLNYLFVTFKKGKSILNFWKIGRPFQKINYFLDVIFSAASSTVRTTSHPSGGLQYMRLPAHLEYLRG